MTKGIDWESRIGRRVRLRDLHVLSAVVQSGSMVKAAAQLNVSQPVVSQAIADLESGIGVRLLDRSSRGVEPVDGQGRIIPASGWKPSVHYPLWPRVAQTQPNGVR